MTSISSNNIEFSDDRRKTDDSEGHSEEHSEESPKNTFDEAIIELMKHIKEKSPPDCDVIVILKPYDARDSILFTQGHPYDVTSMAAKFVKRMKTNLLPGLET